MDIQKELVMLAINGDDEAFSNLYGCIYKDLYRFAYYLLLNEMDAQDVVSDTVLDMYKSIRKLKDAGAFRSWAFKILYIKCKKMRKKYLNKTVELSESLIYSGEDADSQIDILHSMKELTTQERSIIMLGIFGGYSSAEIGELLHMKPATVRSKQSRSLYKMKERLHAYEK